MSLSIYTLKCRRCGHIWEFTGSDLDVVFARCPKCGGHLPDEISRR